MPWVRADTEAVLRLRPDLVLADITMPGKSGLEMLKDIHALHPELPVLVVSMHDEIVYAERCLRAGARGYIMKESGSENLLVAVRRVLDGQSYVSPNMADRILSAQIPGVRTLVIAGNAHTALAPTGLRRMEMIALKLYDLSLDRGLLLVRLGKGQKDRYVPIGERAIAWLQKYIQEGRPLLASEPDDRTVFLTAQGEPFSRDAAQLGKTGSCHLFRHTMATLMHEGGADIRFIQQMLGHEDIKTTQIYTQVAIRTLQQVHAATHPGAMLEKGENPATKATTPDAEALSQMLAAEAEEERE